MEEDHAVERPEELINRYVRLLTATANITSSLGTLALLWSTVVVLGGFVSDLKIRDLFWILTLSFLMAFRVVENYDNGFKKGIYLEEQKILAFIERQKWIQAGMSRYQRFVLGMVIVPKRIVLMILAALSFNVMPFLRLGISVWRLVRRDYGNADGDVANTTKLNAALNIFYALVLFQSLLVIYLVYVDVSLGRSVLEVARVTSKQCGGEKWSPKLVAMYCSETKRKFKKDGELPDRWNLITYGIELLQSASGDDDHLWGARVLDKLSDDEDISSVKRQLLSSRLSIQNLMGMIGPRATQGNMESRERAARIVAHLASDLHITRFPDTLQCICSLLENCCNSQAHPPKAKPDKQTLADKNYHMVAPSTTDQTDEEQAVTISPSAGLANGQRKTYRQMFAEPIQRDIKFSQEVREYSEAKYRQLYKSMEAKEQISQGLMILERLTQDEGNCTEINKDQRLLSMITAPLRNYDFLSKLCDNMMVLVLSKALRVISKLLFSPGYGATRLRQELVGNTEVVNNLMGILETNNDKEGALELHEQAIYILAELASDDSFKEIDFEKLFKALLRIFLEKEADNTRVQEPNLEKATRLMGRVAEALARLIPLATARCTLSKQMAINVLTMVLNAISSSKMGATADTSIGPGDSNSRALEVTIVISQPDIGSVQPPAQEKGKQSEERKFMTAILSLAVVIYNENMISKEDFADCATPEDDEALAKKLKEMLEVNKNSTPECLGIVKVICQVVITMSKLKPSCIQNFNGHNFKEALAEALETMSEVDDCILFAANDREVVKPARSLASLIREAQELLQTA